MPSRCMSDECPFKAKDGLRQYASPKSQYCSICRPVEELEELTTKQVGGLVFIIRRMDPDVRAVALDSLGAKMPALRDSVQASVDRLDADVPPPPHPLSEPVLPIAAPVTPPSLLVSAPVTPLGAIEHGAGWCAPIDMQNQGQWPLCSVYAVAAALAHAMQAKYMTWIETREIMEQFFKSGLPQSAMWPDKVSAFVGAVSVQRLSSRLTINFDTHIVNTFEDTAKLVNDLGGFRCVVIVVRMSPLATQTHTVIGVSWAWGGAIVCQNSWGAENKPLMRVTHDIFVRSYLVDPAIQSYDVPSGGAIVPAQPPAISEDWQWVVSNLSK